MIILFRGIMALQPPLADNVLEASWKSMSLTQMTTEERSHFLEALCSINLKDGSQPRVAKTPCSVYKDTQWFSRSERVALAAATKE